jgi:hypothetical protein
MYIAGKVPAILPGEGLTGYTTLLLSSSDGTDEFRPASRYTQQRFDNDIDRVTLESVYYTGQPLSERQVLVLTIRLSRSSEDTDLSFALRTDNDAKEKAADLEAGLLNILQPNRNMNRLAYPNDGVPTVIFLVGFLAFIFSFMVDNPALKAFCILVFSTAAYLVMHRFMKGYCSFDSNRQKKMDTALKLTFGVFVAFVIVSMLTPLRKQWWGF